MANSITIFFGLLCFLHPSYSKDVNQQNEIQAVYDNSTDPQLTLEWCSSNVDCSSCLTTNGGSRSNCLWCPRDEKCYAYDNFFNPCNKARSINSTSLCSATLPVYKVSVAWQQVVLSAAAYHPDPQTCLDNAPFDPPMNGIPDDGAESPGFRVVSRVNVRCDWIKNKCSAFTAISKKRRLIAVSFRGTHNNLQLSLELLETLTTPMETVLGGKVQRYFKRAFDALWPRIRKSVKRLVHHHPDYDVFVTGHSLGGALANLASTMLVAEGIVPSNKLFSYTFGEPRIGDYDYAFEHDYRVNNSFRITHYRDIVPHVPPAVVPVISKILGGPYHHGTEVYYGDEVMKLDSDFKICLGPPLNEDLTCSYSSALQNAHDDDNEADGMVNKIKAIYDHRHYFDINVSKWHKTGCHYKPSIPRVNSGFDSVASSSLKESYGKPDLKH